MAQRSEDGVGKTREMSKRLERAKAVWARSAISIQASGHVNSRIKRPDTRKHLYLRTNASRKTLLHPAGRPHTDIRPAPETCRSAAAIDWALHYANRFTIYRRATANAGANVAMQSAKVWWSFRRLGVPQRPGVTASSEGVRGS
jgi:hypothetical protein